MTPDQAQAYEEKATVLMEEAAAAKKEVDEVKKRRREVPKHITAAELPEGARFQQLATRSKQPRGSCKSLANQNSKFGSSG